MLGGGWVQTCATPKVSSHCERVKMDQVLKSQIEQIYDALQRRAYDELDGIFHPDYVEHTPMGDFRGVAAFKEYVKGWLDAFPDATFELSIIIGEGDFAAWQARLVGTHTSPLLGLPPTGKPIDVVAVSMGRRSADGRPIEHWTGNDMLMIMQQLGFAPELPGTAAE
jgi:predicted ester cyclase